MTPAILTLAAALSSPEGFTFSVDGALSLGWQDGMDGANLYVLRGGSVGWFVAERVSVQATLTGTVYRNNDGNPLNPSDDTPSFLSGDSLSFMGGLIDIWLTEDFTVSAGVGASVVASQTHIIAEPIFPRVPFNALASNANYGAAFLARGAKVVWRRENGEAVLLLGGDLIVAHHPDRHIDGPTFVNGQPFTVREYPAGLSLFVAAQLL